MEERFYEEYARIQERHWWFRGRREILTGELERDRSEVDGEKLILDIGCGTGPMLEALSRFGTVEAVDGDHAAVDYVRGRGSFEVHQAPATSLPYEDGRYDLVTLLDVIEHIDDDAAALSEARRVLRPGGLALVTVPAYTWMWGRQDEISHHMRRYTRPRLTATLANSGFEVLRATYFNTLLFPPIAAIRLLRRLLPGEEAESSDFELNKPGTVNSVLVRVFAFEARLLTRMSFPFGVSILALARKPGSPAAANGNG